MVRFAWTGLGAAFGEMGQLPGAGLALGIVLVSGLVLAWHGLDWNDLRRRAAAPAALLVGASSSWPLPGSVERPSSRSAVRADQSLPACRCGPLSPCRCGRGRRLHASLARARLGRLRAPPRGHSREHRSHRHYETRNAFTLGDKELTLALPQVPFAHEVPRRLQPMPDDRRPGSRSDGCSTASQPVVYRSLATSLPSSTWPTPACACHCSSPTARSHALVAHELHHAVTRTLEEGQAVRIDRGRFSSRYHTIHS